MSLIPRLLVAYDFSDPARRAFELGVFLSKRLGAELHVATVMDESRAAGPGADQVADGTKRAGDLRRLLEAQTKDALREEATRIECHVLVGEPADAVVALSRKIDAPLILCGTTGKGAVARTLLGSVSHALVQKSGAIVMSVP